MTVEVCWPEVTYCGGNFTEELKKMYQHVQRLNVWNRLNDKTILHELSNLEPQHSGSSFNVAINAMRCIADQGFEKFCEIYSDKSYTF